MQWLMQVIPMGMDLPVEGLRTFWKNNLCTVETFNYKEIHFKGRMIQ